MADQDKIKSPPGNELASSGRQLAELQALNADLRERLEQYRIIFESMDEGFALCEMIFDAQGQAVDFRYLRVNPAFAKLTGLSVDQVTGRTVKEIIPGIEPFWLETYSRVLQTGRSEWIDNPVAELGKHYEVYVWRSGLKRVSVIFNDITEHKQLEKKIRDSLNREKIQRQKLQEEAKVKSLFIDVLAHELRTPLTAILSSSEMLRENPDVTEEIRQRLANNINDGAVVLARRLDELLDLARFSRGSFKLKLQSTNTTSFIEEVAKRFKPALDRSGQKLKLEIARKLPHIELDQSRMEQVIVNLLSNAGKYSLVGGEIVLRADLKNMSLLLEVQDNGIGISPEDQKQLFKTYHRVGKSQQISGVGLGLAITRQIVEAHGGKISLASRLEVGSTFSVLIPIKTKTGKTARSTQ